MGGLHSGRDIVTYSVTQIIGDINNLLPYNVMGK